jgi:hypothetical protein
MEAVRRLNPAGVSPAPEIFWDVEGALKTVIKMIFCCFQLNNLLFHFFLRPPLMTKM